MPFGIWIDICLHSCGVAKASTLHSEHTALSNRELLPWSLRWERGKRHSSPSSRSLGRIRSKIILSTSKGSLKMGERWTMARDRVMRPLYSAVRVCFWPGYERAIDNTSKHLHHC